MQLGKSGSKPLAWGSTHQPQTTFQQQDGDSSSGHLATSAAFSGGQPSLPASDSASLTANLEQLNTGVPASGPLETVNGQLGERSTFIGRPVDDEAVIGGHDSSNAAIGQQVLKERDAIGHLDGAAAPSEDRSAGEGVNSGLEEERISLLCIQKRAISHVHVHTVYIYCGSKQK